VVDVVYWTIQIEWVFYAVVTIGLAIGLVQLRLMAVFIVIGAVTQLVWWYTPGFSLVLFATQWLSRFAVGGILFVLSREPRSRVAWALFAAAVLIMLLGVRQRAVDRVHLEHTVFNPWISCAIMGVATAILTWFALNPTQTVRPLIEFAGGVTFPLYLLHHELGCAVSRALGFGDSLTAVLGMTAGMLLIASFVHGVIEKPLVPRLRRVLTRLFLPRRTAGRP
jgi:peptidoglycan/LPS O-acetylase OafA/YrhL